MFSCVTCSCNKMNSNTDIWCSSSNLINPSQLATRPWWDAKSAGYHALCRLGSKTSSLCSCLFSALGGSSALHIPAFPGGGCLIDYVPQVCHLLTNKVKASPPAPVSRGSPTSSTWPQLSNQGSRASPAPAPSASAWPTLKDSSSVPPPPFPFLRTRLPPLIFISSRFNGGFRQLLEGPCRLHLWCILCLLRVLRLWTPFPRSSGIHTCPRPAHGRMILYSSLHFLLLSYLTH